MGQKWTRYEAVTRLIQARQVVAGVLKLLKTEGLRLTDGSDVGVCAELNSVPQHSRLLRTCQCYFIWI